MIEPELSSNLPQDESDAFAGNHPATPNEPEKFDLDAVRLGLPDESDFGGPVALNMVMQLSLLPEHRLVIEQQLKTQRDLEVLGNLRESPRILEAVETGLVSHPDLVHFLGFMGAPGVGKGTSVGQLIEFLEKDHLFLEALKAQGKQLKIHTISFGMMVGKAREFGLLPEDATVQSALSFLPLVSLFMSKIVESCAEDLRIQDPQSAHLVIVEAAGVTLPFDVGTTALRHMVYYNTFNLVGIFPNREVQKRAEMQRAELAEKAHQEGNVPIESLGHKTVLVGEKKGAFEMSQSMGYARTIKMAEDAMISSISRLIVTDKLSVSTLKVASLYRQSEASLSAEQKQELIAQYLADPKNRTTLDVAFGEYYRYLANEWGVTTEHLFLTTNPFIAGKQIHFYADAIEEHDLFKSLDRDIVQALSNITAVTYKKQNPNTQLPDAPMFRQSAA
jgi:hypothetical protein